MGGARAAGAGTAVSDVGVTVFSPWATAIRGNGFGESAR